MSQTFSWRRRRLTWAAAFLIPSVCIAIAGIRRAPSPAPVAREVGPVTIVARGRIESATRTHVVSGPTGGGTIAELRVNEGQLMSQGNIIAVLDQHPRRQAELQAARLSLKLADQELERFNTGGRPKELEALSARLAMALADFSQQQRQAERAKILGEVHVVSQERVEALLTELERGQQALAQARANLDSARLNFDIDRRIAALHVEQGKVAVEQAAAELETTVVRAPIDGTVLTIAARAGSSIGPDGVVTMADLRNLIVIAEVAAADAVRIRPGDTATVEDVSGRQQWMGHVGRIQHRVFSTQRPSSDVLTGRDARVVEAEIAVDPPGSIPGFIDAEMTVFIRPTVP